MDEIEMQNVVVVSPPAAQMKPLVEYKKKYVFLLVFYYIILCIVPLIAIILIKTSHFENTAATNIANVMLIITYIVSIASFMIIILKNYKKVANSRESLEISTEKLLRIVKTQQSEMIIHALIAVLAIGDSILNLTQLGDKILDMVNSDYLTADEYVYEIIQIAEYGLKTMHHYLLLIFLIYQHDIEQMFLRRPANYFISCLSVSCLYQWVLIILQEVHHGEVEESRLKTNATGGENFLKDFHTIEKMLFPLGVEFRIILFIELLCLSLRSDNDKEHGCVATLLEVLQRIIIGFLNVFLKIFNALFNGVFCCKATTNGTQAKAKHVSLVEYIFMMLLILIGLFSTSSAFVITLFRDNNVETNEELVRMVAELCHLILLLVTLAYLIFLTIILKRRFKTRPLATDVSQTDNEPSIEKKVDFFLLFISNISLIIFHFLSIGGFIKSLTETESEQPEFIKYIELFYSFVPLVESIFQLYLIWLFEHKRNDVLDTSYLNVLAVFNFSLWIFDTFNVLFIISNDILIGVYGYGSWKNIVTIFVPLMIFYRFHCCIILIKIKTEKYAASDER